MQGNPQFLSGGGETGILIRSTNWNNTGLGEIKDWPQSLCTTVSLCLNSKFPMLLLWGENFIQIYNDAFMSILGEKHPHSFGVKAAEVWPEIWPVIEPMLREVMTAGKATWSEDLLLLLNRNGYREECYFTFSLSPVYNEVGKVAGVFSAVTETTDEVIGKRHVTTLRHLAKNISGKKTEEDIYRCACRTFDINNEDFQFATIYSVKKDSTTLHRMGQAGLSPEHPAAPDRIDYTDGGEMQHAIEKVITTNQAVVLYDVSRFGSFSRGFWDATCKDAFILPITKKGEDYPIAILTVGINPHLELTASYKGFFKLIADQISHEVANAHAHEEERNRARELSEIDKAKTTFFSNVSHEFRTPLTLMLGPLEYILKEEKNKLPTEYIENLESAHRNAMRLLKLVNNLLDFSRIEAGRMEAKFQLTDIVSLTQDITSGFRSIIEDAGLQLETESSVGENELYLDKEMWEKILLNLLSNAFKFTVKGKIGVKIRDEGNHIIISVSDTGVGIPQNELPHIFDRFHRINNAKGRTYEGSGIGLSLVYELVKIHNGEISVISKEGEGTTFNVKLLYGHAHLDPNRVQEDVESVASRASTREVYLNEAMGISDGGDRNRDLFTGLTGEKAFASDEGAGKKRILVVDDNADMRTYISRLLSPYYTVDVSLNGLCALEQISKNKPDLVLSDIMMPLMDGKELLLRMKADQAWVDIPVILVSARAGEESKIDGYSAGADDYLVKPFTGSELLARVRSQIKLSQTRKLMRDRMRSVFMQAPVAIAIVNGPDYTVELANRRMLEYCELREEETLHKSAFELMPELEAQGYKKIFEEVYAGGKSFSQQELKLEFIRGNNPEERYVNLAVEPMYDIEGNITGLMTVANDVTEQVLAKRKIKMSETRYQELIWDLPIAVYTLDKNGYIRLYNEEALKLWGREPELEKDRWCGSLKAFDSNNIPLKEEEDPLYVLMHGGEHKKGKELSIERPDGSRRHIVPYPRLIKNNKGEIRGAVNVVLDITESKEAERALKASEEKYRDLIHGLPAAIYTCNKEGYITIYNKAAVNLWGRTPRVGKDLWCGSWKIFEPDGITPVDIAGCPMAIALKEGKAITGKEIIVEKPDGTRRNVLPYPRPIYDAEGSIIGAVNMLIDITEQKITEQVIRESEERYKRLVAELEIRVQIRTRDLSDANHKLRRSNEELEQFAYIASHDLQEPLRKIQTFSELLEMNLKDGKLAKRYLDKINSSAGRMKVLIKDVLNYSRLSGGEREFEEIDLNRVIEQVQLDFELSLIEKKAVVEKQELPKVKGIDLHVNQLFSNLFSNALKFSSEFPIISISSGKVTTDEKVMNDLKPDLEYCRITFKDNGIGFEQDYSEQIFTIFQRLHYEQKYAGTGIGLALCRKIVENHGGKITAAGKPGKGATFYIYLPV